MMATYAEAVNAYRDYVIKTENLRSKQNVNDLKPLSLSETLTLHPPSLYERAIRFTEILKSRKEYRLRLKDNHQSPESPLNKVHPLKRRLVIQGARIKNHIDDLENLVSSESLSQEEFDETVTQIAKSKKLYDTMRVRYEKEF